MTGSIYAPSTGHDLQTPALWTLSAQQRFFRGWATASTSPLLICDYDGTLAPFQADKMQAYPYAGVADRLERIANGPSRLALVSGRPTHELMLLLPLAARLELWGAHGREHYTPDGQVHTLDPSESQLDSLDQAQEILVSAGWGPAVERKVGSLAVHWRNLSEGEKTQLQQVAEHAFQSHAGLNHLALLPFDGGLELRTEDQTKGHSIAALLGEESGHTAAFLGDDFTDEDGFAVLNERHGLSLLVREQARPSRADYFVQPPEALLAFLDAWIEASEALVAKPGAGHVVSSEFVPATFNER